MTKLLVSVRGGGHNIAGNAVCDGGLMIDLSLDEIGARRSAVAHGARRARRHAGRLRQGGAGASGLPRRSASTRPPASPASRSAAASAGPRRKFGLTVDNLISADVVTADGRAGARQRRREPGPVLGIARRRRQFRRRDLVRVQAASARPARCCRAWSCILSTRQANCCPSYRAHRQGGAGRADGLGRDAQGAAAAVPAGRMARQGGPHLRRLLQRRHRRGREGHAAVCALSASRSPT